MNPVQTILIQHPHTKGEISGVLTYVSALSDSLSKTFRVGVETVSSAETTVTQRFAAVRRSSIVHLNSNDLWMVLFAKILRKRVVFKLHYLTYQSIHFEYVPMEFKRRIATEVGFLWRRYGLAGQKRVFLEATMRLALRLCVLLTVDRVTACSDFVGESTALRRVSTIYNPAASPSPFSSQRPNTPHTPYFCFVGRLSSDKGCDLLIAAAANLASQTNPSFEVKIVGDGEQRDALERQVKDLGLQNVSFLGQLPAEGVSEVLSGALALVVPSRWQEPAGYTPVEASMHGVPTIASRVGGIPETAGPHAFYFERESSTELSSHLSFALRNIDSMSFAGVASRDYARSMFHPDVTARAFLTAAQLL